MTTRFSVSKLCEDLENKKMIYDAVLKAYPDAEADYYGTFYSRTVNKNYTDFSFYKEYNGLYVSPYCEIEVNMSNGPQFIKIYSIPTKSKLVHITYDRHPDNKKFIMKFARFIINQKNNQFSDRMLNECKVQIASFIKDNPNYHLDTKHLDPRIKKMLSFI